MDAPPRSQQIGGTREPDPQRHYAHLREKGFTATEARRLVRMRFFSGPPANRPSSLHDELARVRGELAAARVKIEGLERDLAEANGFIEALECELRAATFGGRSTDQEKRPADLRILLLRARTACRRTLHPDSKPEWQKVRSTRAFQDCESAFDRIIGLVGLRS
jgi:hypothetical protein